ncbi:hypothetical protein ACFY7H_13520 [Streptomyces sp. NPDC012794]|uniref:hypothetical protein n=1 Tax=Streptomyces sp. NPDC012794 TaxID=3364850 RepID=UPI00367DAB8C
MPNQAVASGTSAMAGMGRRKETRGDGGGQPRQVPRREAERAATGRSEGEALPRTGQARGEVVGQDAAAGADGQRGERSGRRGQQARGHRTRPGEQGPESEHGGGRTERRAEPAEGPARRGGGGGVHVSTPHLVIS